MKFLFKRQKADPLLAHQPVDEAERAAREELISRVSELSGLDQDALISFLGVHLPEINEGELEMISLPDNLASLEPNQQFKYLNRPFRFENPPLVGQILQSLINENQRLIIALETLRQN